MIKLKHMTKQKYPEPTVGALIFNQEGEILLVASPKWRGKYVIPGGHIETGETIEQALKREVKEETNLDVFDIKFISFQEFIYNEDFHEKRHFIFLDYACKTNDKEVILNKEGSEYVWIDIDKISKLSIEPYTLNTIKHFKEKYL